MLTIHELQSNRSPNSIMMTVFTNKETNTYMHTYLYIYINMLKESGNILNW
jgi:hypothetical protein